METVYEIRIGHTGTWTEVSATVYRAFSGEKRTISRELPRTDPSPVSLTSAEAFDVCFGLRHVIEMVETQMYVSLPEYGPMLTERIVGLHRLHDRINRIVAES